MRGLFTAGIIDVMMEAGVEPDGLIGVSAGAAFGCNYKSRQPGRAIRYNTRFAKDPRYSGLRSLIKSGDYFNAEFGYHIVPKQYDIFDVEAFEQNPMAFIVVCTDVLTGKAVYHKMERVNFDELEWLRASASMPLASKVVEVGGRKLLDGGVADSIPLEYFESIGYERNVVILTQPMIEAMATRHLMYNRELEYVREAEREGRCLVIRPDEKLPIGHICHDPEKMRRVYEIGRRMGERYIDRIKDFYR